MKRRDRCRDRRTVPLDASGCGFPSTAGSQAGNALNLLRSTSSIDLRTASQKISKARRVPLYLKRDHPSFLVPIYEPPRVCRSTPERMEP